MKKPPHRIFNTSSFSSTFDTLKRGDVICGRMKMRVQEEHVLLDLVERGVHLIPSATSQMASRSKTFQARIFSPWMIPQTAIAYSTHHLLEIINQFQKQSINKVVVKHDRRNAGAGILLYNGIEDVFNQAANNMLPFPFVVQPYLGGCEDIRVILLGDYAEAYTRFNPYNFRNNLHCGGQAEPCTLSDEMLGLCHRIMRRGSFPYGHLDLMKTATGDIFLAEINLRGGIRGARITITEYKEKVAAIEKKLLKEFETQLSVS